MEGGEWAIHAGLGDPDLIAAALDRQHGAGPLHHRWIRVLRWGFLVRSLPGLPNSGRQVAEPTEVSVWIPKVMAGSAELALSSPFADTNRRAR
jgi:hypothetical protein